MGLCLNKPLTKDDGKTPTAALGGRNVTLITTIGKWEEKISDANRDGKLVVANFSASWCNPCRSISAAYDDLADKYTSLMFLTVDIDELAEFSSSWDIKATPTFFFLKNGRQVDKFVGPNKEELQRKIATIADSLASTHS